jgi:hypothetical protein
MAFTFTFDPLVPSPDNAGMKPRTNSDLRFDEALKYIIGGVNSPVRQV